MNKKVIINDKGNTRNFSFPDHFEDHLYLDPKKLTDTDYLLERVGGSSLTIGQSFGIIGHGEKYLKENTTEEVFEWIMNFIKDVCDEQNYITQELICLELYKTLGGDKSILMEEDNE